MKKTFLTALGIFIAGGAFAATIVEMPNIAEKGTEDTVTHLEFNSLTSAVEQVSSVFDAVSKTVEGVLTIPSSANVGLSGTGSLLRVKGDLSVSDDGFGRIVLGDNSAATNQKYFSLLSTGDNLTIGAVDDNHSGTLGALVLDRSSNLGIATTNIDAGLRVDVNGNIGADAICDEAGLNCHDISTGWSMSPWALDGDDAVFNPATGRVIVGDVPASSSFADEMELFVNGDVAVDDALYIGTPGTSAYTYINDDGISTADGLRVSGLTTLGTIPSGYTDFGDDTELRVMGTASFLDRIYIGEPSNNDYITMSEGEIWATDSLQVGNGVDGYVNIGESNIIADGDVTAAAFLYASDKRLKENIQPLNNALDTIEELEGVSFDWKEGEKDQIGFIAQDVEEVVPALVETNEETGMKSVAYGNVTALLVEALKEQQEINKGLQGQIDILNAALQELQ